MQLVKAGVTAELIGSGDSLFANGEEPLVIDGYCDRMSCQAGETIGLCVSTNAEFYSAEVSRVGIQRQIIWKRDRIPGGLYPIPDQAGMFGCGWPVSVAIPVGRNWKSGIYAIQLRGQSGDRETELREAIFIVRSAQPGRENPILLQVATNTYQAYNEWGGTNLYSGPNHPRASFHRPFKIYDLPLVPGANWYNPNTSNYHAWDEPFIIWAERAGYGIDFCANLDLEQHPEILKHYQLILSVGHDEYWSAGMRDTLEAYIENGGNVAFFSGNSICWQVRVENNGRELVCYKRAHDRDPVFNADRQHLLTTLWSDPLVGRPENELSGVGFPYGGYNGLHGEFMRRDGTVGTYTNGGTVVTVGSCDWSDGLRAGNKTVDRIVRNILDRLLA